MRQLIRRLEEVTAVDDWAEDDELDFLHAAQTALAKHGYKWKIRVDAGRGAVNGDVQIKGVMDADAQEAGTLLIEVSRVKKADGSVIDAGAWFYPSKRRQFVVVDGKDIPQSKNQQWPPDPSLFGKEAGDMIAQVYEMAVREGFVASKK